MVFDMDKPDLLYLSVIFNSYDTYQYTSSFFINSNRTSYSYFTANWAYSNFNQEGYAPATKTTISTIDNDHIAHCYIAGKTYSTPSNIYVLYCIKGDVIRQ